MNIEKIERLFGVLAPYIMDTNITDINCNSHTIWVDHVEKQRYCLDNIYLTSEEIEHLAEVVANLYANEQFNSQNPILETEIIEQDMPCLRLEFIHSTLAKSGTCVSIRKTPREIRINAKESIENGYCSKSALQLLEIGVKLHKNFIICGVTGAGKTEFAKFLTSMIPLEDRIITMEDTQEMHLLEIFPERDIVELMKNHRVDYTGLIHASMRLKPTWLLLSEARGNEVSDLFKAVSTGAKLITTIHTDSAFKIPSRILNMFADNELSNQKIERMIYEYINFGIHVKCVNDNGQLKRYIDQIICFYIDEKGEQKNTLIYKYDKGITSHFELPDFLLKEIQDTDIQFSWGDA